MPCPKSDFALIDGNKYICCVFAMTERNHPINQITCDTLARLLVVEDEEFYSFLEDSRGKESVSIKPLQVLYYDIEYVRECRLKHVLRKEWKLNYGPNSYLEYVKLKGDSITPDSRIKVIAMERVSYNLDDLNKKYKNDRSQSAPRDSQN